MIKENKPSKYTVRFKVLGWADVYLDELSTTEYMVTIFKNNGSCEAFKFSQHQKALQKYESYKKGGEVWT